MSLYYEAAATVANEAKVGGSLKSRIYNKTDLKSAPAQVFALVTEASKWSVVLKDVIEKSGVMREEKKLTPILTLLLTHDLLISKRGVAAPSDHVLKLAIGRHKARLSAEFTKARIKGGHSTLEAFRKAVNDGVYGDAPSKSIPHPRWVRVNTLKTSMEEQLSTTFANYTKVEDLSLVISAQHNAKVLHVDKHIPDLLALPPKANLRNSQKKAYAGGEIIFQDKASCFPAYLLNVQPEDGQIVDACAAPGNKTSHLAALVDDQDDKNPRIHAFEKDKARTLILRKMLKIAGTGGRISIHGGRDFLLASTRTKEFSKVDALLLDPSCSGSGIVGRDDALKMHLPDPQAGTPSSTSNLKGKKRKRGGAQAAQSTPGEPSSISFHYSPTEIEDEPEEQESPDLSADTALETRLTALSNFQLGIIKHAMWFPAARKITYSTCSIHFAENEGVVFRALESEVAKKRGWRVLKRKEQVEGLKKWNKRGIREDHGDVSADLGEEKRKEVLEACLRCEAGTEEGTMGFFVVGFVRDGDVDVDVEGVGVDENDEVDLQDTTTNGVDEGDEEWNGFSEEEGDGGKTSA